MHRQRSGKKGNNCLLVKPRRIWRRLLFGVLFTNLSSSSFSSASSFICEAVLSRLAAVLRANENPAGNHVVHFGLRIIKSKLLINSCGNFPDFGGCLVFCARPRIHVGHKRSKLIIRHIIRRECLKIFVGQRNRLVVFCPLQPIDGPPG